MREGVNTRSHIFGSDPQSSWRTEEDQNAAKERRKSLRASIVPAAFANLPRFGPFLIKSNAMEQNCFNATRKGNTPVKGAVALARWAQASNNYYLVLEAQR